MERKIIYLDDAIDALRYAQHRFTVADEAGGMGTVKWSEDVIYFATAERVLAELPSAQPEKRTEERTETHACDLISRQAAIESVADEIWHYPNECYKNLNVFENAKDLAEHALRGLPSAEPERKKGNEKCSNELPCGWCSLFDTPCFGRGGEQDG